MAPSTTSPACRRRSRCRRSCKGPRARSSSPSACCAPTRASRTCSRRSARSAGRSCGSSATRACRSSRCTSAAALTGAKVRFVTRFVEDAEIPAIFRRADVVALPYLDAEHSGVLYTALAFGKPMVVSAVGGFPEVADAGAARLVPPGDTAALAAALRELIDDPGAREELGRRRPRGRRRSLLLGRGRPPDAGALRGTAGGDRASSARTARREPETRDHARRDRLLALRPGDRLHPGRLPARAAGAGLRPPRPRNARRPAGAALARPRRSPPASTRWSR